MENFFADGLEFYDGWDSDTGKPGIGLVGRSIQFFSYQNQPCTVSDVVTAFKMSGPDVIQAVEDHPWMYLEGPDDDFSKMIIEHDGD